MSPAMIDLAGVSKRNGPAYAVHDLTLAVERGEFCCLLGPSGCGKTTTLKLINRMIRADAGTILVGGRDIRAVRPEELRRGMGYVIQSIGLFPHMTVLENIRVVPGLLGWEKERSLRRARELLALFGLPPDAYGRKYPSELSGGQAQRVGVARALAADPEILLMDEPFGALDPISREKLQDEFARIQRELRKTILFVTHDIDEALRLGSRIALLHKGELVQYDTPEILLGSPANAFVKRFIGADRALKRLALATVEERVHRVRRLTLDAPESAVRELFAAEPGRRFAWVTDEAGRVAGWLDRPEPDWSGDVRESLIEVAREGFAVSPGTSLRQALDNFIRHGVATLPVVDDACRLQGEIRLSDILGAGQEARPG